MWVLAGVALGVVFWAVLRLPEDRDIEILNTFDEPPPDPGGSFSEGSYVDESEIVSMPTQVQNVAEHPLLKLVQRYESGGRYNVLYGGDTFASFDRHPWDYDQPASAYPRILTGSNRGLGSSAAGRYQFLLRTWKRLQKKLNLPDFSPASQDAAAYEYLVERGAIAAYNRGDLEGAIRKAAGAWTSLPTSSTGEAQLSMAAAVNELRSYV